MRKKVFAFVGAAIAAVAATFTYFSFDEQISLASTARDCDNNAIVYCGATSASELKQKYTANKTGDLDNVYAHYGISKAMMANAQDAKLGRVYRDGTVKVDGKVVATGAQSVGRLNMNGSTKVTIGGKTFYQRATSVSFRAEYISAYVFFDENGKYEAAVLASCGNPVKAKPVAKPLYLCTGLSVAAVTGSREKVTIKANAKVVDATFSGITYTIKDKSGKVVATIDRKDQNAFTYTQATAGTYSVEAVVRAVVNGKTVSTPVGDCKKSFTIPPVPVTPPTPKFTCDGLEVKKVERTKFTFTATRTVTNATYVHTLFTIRDKSGKDIVTLTEVDGTAEYTQAKEGEYSVQATVVVKVNGQEKRAEGEKCKATFTVEATPITPEYTCSGIELIKKSRTDYVARVTATTKGDATAKTIKVDFGDGTTETAEYGKEIAHTYKTAGTYTVTAHVSFTVAGKPVADITGANCKETLEIEPEAAPSEYLCKELAVQTISRDTYRFTVKVTTKGNATAKTVTVDFGDGSTPFTGALGDEIKHSYKTAGTYTAKASVTFEADGKTVSDVTSANCAKPVTVAEEPIEECKPGIPVGDTRCTETPVVPPTPEQPKEEGQVLPAVIAKTGPEALLGGAIGSSALGLGIHSYLASRRALKNAFKK